VRRALQVVQLAATALAAGALLLLGAAVLPNVIGFQSYAVLSGSMEPAIPLGAAVVTQPVAPEQVREGDVITFSVTGLVGVVVTHRVIGVERTGLGPTDVRLRTKGDANADEHPVPADVHRPLARVVYWVPFAGYLMEASTVPAVRGFFVVLGLVLIWTTGWPRRGSANATNNTRGTS